MRFGDSAYLLKTGAWRYTNDAWYEDMEYSSEEAAKLGGRSAKLEDIRAAWLAKGAPLDEAEVRTLVGQ